MARDTYRQKLYDAEREAFRGMRYDRDRTMADVVVRIHRLQATSQAWRAAAGEKAADALITVDRATGGTSWANTMRWRISIAKGHVGNDWVLLHEMAHLPTSNQFAAHGREFTQLYVAMAREAYGDEQADLLRASILCHGVPVGYDDRYVKYLRRHVAAVAADPDRFTDIELVTRDGRRLYSSEIAFDRDTITLVRSYQAAATPVTVRMDDLAYFTRRERRSW